jgi:hypothetical protein
MQLTADMILRADDLRRERVDVPEWGGAGAFLFIRTMTGLERDVFETTLFVGEGADRKVAPNFTARLVALTACDETGKRLFEDRQIQALGEKSASTLQRVAKVAQRLNGIGAAEVEEVKKDSDAGLISDSSSA